MRILGQPVSSFLPDFHPIFSDSFADIQFRLLGPAFAKSPRHTSIATNPQRWAHFGNTGEKQNVSSALYTSGIV